MANLIRGFIPYKSLDWLFSKYNPKSPVLYLDIKNMIYSVYVESLARQFLSKSVIYDFTLELVELLKHYLLYGVKHQIDLKIVIYFDQGESLYHRNINSNYKLNRKISRFKTISILEENNINENFNACINVSKKMFNTLYNTYYISLSYLESDFVPYYVISNNLLRSDFNIIFSADKDMTQCLELDHTIIYNVHSKKLFGPKNWHKRYNLSTHLLLPWFSVGLAIVGDISDNVIGIHGIGWKTFEKLVINTSCMYKKDYHMKDFIDCMRNDYQFIQNNLRKYARKIIDNEDLLINNYKLVSFKELIKSLTHEQKNEIMHSFSLEKLSEEQSFIEIEELITHIKGI